MLLSLPPKLRSNYSASKTGRGIVFSPRFLSPGKNRNNVGNYTTKEEEPADGGGGEGEGGEGSKPRWYKGERSLDGERSGVVSESVTFTVSRSNLVSYSCFFFCFGQSPGELKENFILQLPERETCFYLDRKCLKNLGTPCEFPRCFLTCLLWLI